MFFNYYYLITFKQFSPTNPNFLINFFFLLLKFKSKELVGFYNDKIKNKKPINVVK